MQDKNRKRIDYKYVLGFLRVIVIAVRFSFAVSIFTSPGWCIEVYMLFLDLKNGVKAEKSVKGFTRVQPGTGVTCSSKTESTGQDKSKPGAVQPSLDATLSAYEQGGTPGD